MKMQTNKKRNGFRLRDKANQNVTPSAYPTSRNGLTMLVLPGTLFRTRVKVAETVISSCFFIVNHLFPRATKVMIRSSASRAGMC